MNVISGSAPTLGVSYDPATNHGSCSDANGNDFSCAYRYDVENRIVSTQLYQAGMQYSYAPGNRRVWRGDRADDGRGDVLGSERAEAVDVCDHDGAGNLSFVKVTNS